MDLGFQYMRNFVAAVRFEMFTHTSDSPEVSQVSTSCARSEPSGMAKRMPEPLSPQSA